MQELVFTSFLNIHPKGVLHVLQDEVLGGRPLHLAHVRSLTLCVIGRVFASCLTYRLLCVENVIG